MATEEEVESLWDHLNNINEDDIKRITKKMTKQQLLEFTFDYIRSTIFTSLDFNLDGRLEMLGGQVNENEWTITTFDKQKYRITFEKVDD